MLYEMFAKAGMLDVVAPTIAVPPAPGSGEALSPLYPIIIISIVVVAATVLLVVLVRKSARRK